MKRIQVFEQWCLGCHLCEYYCAYANSGIADMADALKDVKINPLIKVEGNNRISFAVSCRHCDDPKCVYACITGAFHIEDGAVRIDREKCVGCYTCILSCPYGAIVPSPNRTADKCELCMNNSQGAPACARNCPNRAIVFSEEAGI